jgi:hypothetical protein
MPTTVKIRRSGTASATPSALEHGEIAINYADGKVFWKNASDVITSFTFQSYALASHTHSISDVTGLQTALDGKASSSHAHSISDVTGLQTALDGKAASSHTHSISDVTGLQTALDGKASSSHTHAASDITSGTLDIARIANDAVTYAKIQNVSATSRILGRSSAGAGDVEELDAATARTVMSVQPTASPAFTGAATFANTGNVVPLTVNNSGTSNSFVVNDDGSGDSTPFVIDAAGNVGIGASAPSNPLHIANAIPTIRLEDTDTNAVALLTADNSGSLRLRADTGNAQASSSISLEVDTVAYVIISSTGTATFAGQILADDIDTANSVAYGFDSDPDTGIGRGGANVLTLVTGGVEAVTLNSGQMLLCRKGFALQGEARPSSGAGLEVNYVSASNAATIGAYDRTNNVYKELHLFGSVIDFQIGAGSDMQLNASGELLIGTTSDNGNYKLQVNSQIYATNATIATSDARFKTNVESLTDATSVIQALRPVAFDFIPQEDRNFATERQVGLIAQETQAALAGTDYADSVVAQCGDHLGLAYEKLVPVLIKALQESNARIAALEERING